MIRRLDVASPGSRVVPRTLSGAPGVLGLDQLSLR